jgi:quinol monooxygenase YgiN
MVTTGLVVRLEAQPGKEQELAAFLTEALPLVKDEPDTLAWFAVRTGASSFAIVDVFPNEAGRKAHLDGPVAAALIAKAPELLAQPPQIEHADVVAAKLKEAGR